MRYQIDEKQVDAVRFNYGNDPEAYPAWLLAAIRAKQIRLSEFRQYVIDPAGTPILDDHYIVRDDDGTLSAIDIAEFKANYVAVAE
jgi:hypothetical protein